MRHSRTHMLLPNFIRILTLRSLQALWYELSSCNRTILSFSGASFDLVQ